MVYESQGLEYLKAMKRKHLFDFIELVVFRHEQNLNKKDEIEARIHKYIDKAATFWSFPAMCIQQLNANARCLWEYLEKIHR